MSIKLNEARQKKADELGLPWSYVPDIASVPEKDWELFEKFQMESANRVLHLEQAVETLRDALREITKCEGAYNPDRLKHAENCMNSMCKVAREALEQTEACHE